MSIEDNKALVRRFYLEVVGGGDLTNLDAFVGGEYVDRNAGPEAGRGPAVVRAHLQAIRATFPDFTVSVDDVIAEGDRVMTRVSGRGTHRGEWQGIRPTGRVVQLRGINIDRIAAGKLVEHRGEADTVGMLWQMGVDPFAGRR